MHVCIRIRLLFLETIISCLFQLSKISLNNSNKERSQQYVNEKHSLARNEQICSVAFEKSRGEVHALTQKVLK